tara:strand:+ start:9245 stop:9478 length:234 start_codon:yes stop_codon:yes gene_type:complete
MLSENYKEENEFNYFAYNIDNLLTLHENLQNNYKLYNFMNKSKSSNFIQIILDTLEFLDDVYIDDSKSDISDDEFSN